MKLLLIVFAVLVSTNAYSQTDEIKAKEARKAYEERLSYIESWYKELQTIATKSERKEINRVHKEWQTYSGSIGYVYLRTVSKIDKLPFDKQLLAYDQLKPLADVHSNYLAYYVAINRVRKTRENN